MTGSNFLLPITPSFRSLASIHANFLLLIAAIDFCVATTKIWGCRTHSMRIISFPQLCNTSTKFTKWIRLDTAQPAGYSQPQLKAKINTFCPPPHKLFYLCIPKLGGYAFLCKLINNCDIFIFSCSRCIAFLSLDTCPRPLYKRCAWCEGGNICIGKRGRGEKAAPQLPLPRSLIIKS